MKKASWDRPVHVALISPGEMETEDVFVKEVTKSCKKKKFPTTSACFFTVPKQTNKRAFMLNVASFSLGLFLEYIPVQAVFFFKQKKLFS